MGVFSRGEVFGERGTLHIMFKGLVGRQGRLIRQGGVWGEDFCLTNTDLMDSSRSVALTFCSCLTMHGHTLRQILQRFPGERVWIRKAVIKLALIRGVMLLASKTEGRYVPRSWLIDDRNPQPLATASEIGG